MNTTAELTKLVAEAQQQTLSALRHAQDLSIRATEAAVSALPRAEQTDAPSPRHAVESAFGFAGRVLESQRAYALRLTEVLNPPVPQTTEQ